VARLTTHIDPASPAFAANEASMRDLVNDLEVRLADVQRGGEQATERHRGRGKLPARERIEQLVDAGSAFLELSALAACDLYDGDAPAA
jgi:3-methylcrotonyl-CoA carboxylase beta subunit